MSTVPETVLSIVGDRGAKLGILTNISNFCNTPR